MHSNSFIPISQPSITALEVEYIMKAVQSGWISSLGEYIEQFETKFAEYSDCRYGVACANGTVALHLALSALGIGRGDEVIVPDLTFVATPNTVCHAGATPVFVDIDPQTLCIDPVKIEEAITKHTKAIMPVHLYGHPADMEAIMYLAHKHNLLVIEDAAEAHGAKIKGKKVGSWGDCSAFSFYGNKIITSGEGGIVTTNSAELAERMKMLRDHAMSKEKRYWHHEIGFNYRMTNVQAALVCAQLKRIDDILNKKKMIFERYQKNLGAESHLRLNYQAPWAEMVYWMVCVEIDGLNDMKRDRLMKMMKEHSIDSRPYFYPMSFMPMYKSSIRTPLSVSTTVYEKGLNLPSYYDMTLEQIDYASEIVLKLSKSI